MNDYELLIPDSMNGIFMNENEKNAAKCFMEYVFYGSRPEISPQAWHDARKKILYDKYDICHLDEETKKSGNKALDAYTIRYVINHLSKQEICEIVSDFFYHSGHVCLMEFFNKKLGIDLDNLFMKQKKRIIKKEDITNKYGSFDWRKYDEIFERYLWVEFNDDAFDTIVSDFYNGSFWCEALYFLNDLDGLKKYDRWFFLCKHILITSYDYEDFYTAGKILSVIMRTIDPKDRETVKWMNDQIFEIFWYRVGSIWPILHQDELNDNEGKIVKESIRWLETLEDLKKRLPELPSSYYHITPESDKDILKDAMKEFKKIIKNEESSHDDIGIAIEKIIDSSFEEEPIDELEKLITEKVVPEIQDVEFLEYLEKIIKKARSKIKRVAIERKNIVRIREHLKKWPESVSGYDNPEFLNEIQLEHIMSAECERVDPYFEKVASPWFMHMELVVNGKKCKAHIHDQSLYRKYYEMITRSGEFDCESEIPMQYGREVFTRKK